MAGAAAAAIDVKMDTHSRGACLKPPGIFHGHRGVERVLSRDAGGSCCGGNVRIFRNSSVVEIDAVTFITLKNLFYFFVIICMFLLSHSRAGGSNERFFVFVCCCFGATDAIVFA